MMSVPAGPIPTLLVTGFVGVGKTTLIAGWLARRPPGERWAVLINGSGATGIGRAAGADAKGIDAKGADARNTAEVFEVAGGCACCAAGVAFRATLTRLLRRGPWDRLLIEASGLGHPAQLVDRLREPSLQPLLALLPPVAVVDARRPAPFLDDAHPAHPSAAAQTALARLLIVNRAADVDPHELRRLTANLAALPPWPRPVLESADADLPLGDVLAALDDDRAAAASPRIRDVDGGRACDWRWPAERVFDRRRLEDALKALSDEGGSLRARGLLRMKGVFRTERAWYGWRWSDGQHQWAETQWRADSRLEAIAIRDFDPQIVDKALDRAE